MGKYVIKWRYILLYDRFIHTHDTSVPNIIEPVDQCQFGPCRSKCLHPEEKDQW